MDAFYTPCERYYLLHKLTTQQLKVILLYIASVSFKPVGRLQETDYIIGFTNYIYNYML